MMRMHNINMKTRVDKRKLLEALRSNLSRHSAIVQEARDGYIQAAKKALEIRLEQLRKGKVVALSFTLTPPEDYSEIYKNVISMLEWNSNDYVELQADEFRQLVEDKWDWQKNWLFGNTRYSKMSEDLYTKEYGDNDSGN